MKKPGQLILLALYVGALEAIIPHERFTPEHLDYTLSGAQNGFIKDKYSNLYQTDVNHNRLDPTRPKRTAQNPRQGQNVVLGPKLPTQPRDPRLRPRPPGPKYPGKGPRAPKKSNRSLPDWRPWESDVQETEPLMDVKPVRRNSVRPPPMRRPAHFMQRSLSQPEMLISDRPPMPPLPTIPAPLETDSNNIDPGFSPPSLEDIIKRQNEEKHKSIDPGFGPFHNHMNLEADIPYQDGLLPQGNGDDYLEQPVQHMPFDPALYESAGSNAFGETDLESNGVNYGEDIQQAFGQPTVV